ncbi:fibulin-1-like [Clytia hemisphaerica]|uniref:EGF-like domain-containing protein n=1 Tax=Clytia hemisphaerica TaxID=252671 RepID=A0A7M5X703_9CNID
MVAMNFFFLVLIVCIYNSVDTLKVESSCCKEGVSFYNANIKDKENSRMCYEERNRTKGLVCHSIRTLCCLNSQREESCKQGVEAVMVSGRSCNKLTSVAFLGSSFKCCECCKLGRQHALDHPDKEDGEGCKTSEFNDKQCNNVFESCCKKTKEAAKKPQSCEELECEHVCQQTNSGPFCSCKQGYQLNKDNKTCEDINECLTQSNKCVKGFECHNLPGSYTCRRVYKKINCPDGYEQVNDFCRDVDECKNGQAKCQNGTFCENVLGGYQCTVKDNKHKCQAGSYKYRGRCIDKNECKSRPCRAYERCVNTVGSYKCVAAACPVGYRFDGSSCTDINECKEVKNICSGSGERCVNTLGAYQCFCKSGFKQNQISKTCEDINECTNRARLCAHKCYNLIGGYQCACHKGFKLHSNKRSCLDIDECREKKNVCGSNDRCINVRGDFICFANTCPIHYRKQGRSTCKKACPTGQNCGNLPLYIRKFIRSRSRTSTFRIPLTVSTRRYGAVTDVYFEFTQGNEENEYKLKRFAANTVLIHATKGNFATVEPFKTELKIQATISRLNSSPVKILYHLYLNFY